MVVDQNNSVRLLLSGVSVFSDLCEPNRNDGDSNKDTDAGGDCGESSSEDCGVDTAHWRHPLFSPDPWLSHLTSHKFSVDILSHNTSQHITHQSIQGAVSCYNMHLPQHNKPRIGQMCCYRQTDLIQSSPLQ